MKVQRWPTAWLLTDERMGSDLDAAIGRAAGKGAGIIVRHHQSSLGIRRGIAKRVRSEGALLGVSRNVALGEELGAALIHNPVNGSNALPFSLSVHDGEEARQAALQRPALVFISPVCPTRSHPQTPALGAEAALALARATGVPAIALGGMDAQRGTALMQRGFHGWAGIDCWLRT